MEASHLFSRTQKICSRRISRRFGNRQTCNDIVIKIELHDCVTTVFSIAPFSQQKQKTLFGLFLWRCMPNITFYVFNIAIVGWGERITVLHACYVFQCILVSSIIFLWFLFLFGIFVNQQHLHLFLHNSYLLLSNFHKIRFSIFFCKNTVSHPYWTLHSNLRTSHFALALCKFSQFVQGLWNGSSLRKECSFTPNH